MHVFTKKAGAAMADAKSQRYLSWKKYLASVANQSDALHGVSLLLNAVGQEFAYNIRLQPLSGRLRKNEDTCSFGKHGHWQAGFQYLTLRM